MRAPSVVLLFGLFATVFCALTPKDVSRFEALFSSSKSLSTLDNAYYAAIGMKALGKSLPQDACKVAQGYEQDVSSAFRAVTVAEATSGCKISAPKGNIVNDALASKAASKIYHAVVVAKHFGSPLNAEDVDKALKVILAGEVSVADAGSVFNAAAVLGGINLDSYFDSIEEVVAQSSKSGDTQFFEGGMATTSFVVKGIFSLAEAAKKAPSIKEEVVVGFSEYFRAGQGAHALLDAAAVVSGLNALSGNFLVPVCTSLETPTLRGNQGVLVVRVTQPNGRPVPNPTVSLTALTDAQGVLSTKGPLTPVSGDSSTFQISLSSIPRGSLKAKIKVSHSEKKFLTRESLFTFVATSKATVTNAKLAVLQGTEALKSFKLSEGKKESFEADMHQKLSLTFSVQGEDGSALKPHQAFVRFTHATTKQEVFFVAEPSKDLAYSFDLKLNDAAESSFGRLSGAYEMHLIVGDASFDDAIVWHLATATLSLGAGTPPAPRHGNFLVRPEIQHLFRPAEARPPAIISLVFGGLVLAPLLILIVLLFKYGANVSNFSFAPMSLLFHAGFAATLLLIATFWLRLNMFETLQYLAVLMTLTFLAGKSTLGALAAKRLKPKAE